MKKKMFSEEIRKIRHEELYGVRYKESKYNLVERRCVLTENPLDRMVLDRDSIMYDPGELENKVREYQDPFILKNRERRSWDETYEPDPMHRVLLWDEL